MKRNIDRLMKDIAECIGLDKNNIHVYDTGKRLDDSWYPEFKQICNDFSAGELSRLRSKFSIPDTTNIHLEITDTLKPEACACRCIEGNYCLCISEGISKAIYRHAINLLSNKSLCVFLQEVHGAPEENILQKYIITSMLGGFHFTIAHEFLHIALGHVDYVRSNYGPKALCENEHISGVDPDVQQAMELQADLIAIRLLVESGRYNDVFMGHGLVILLDIFNYARLDIEDYKGYSHPHPLVRLLNLYSAFSEEDSNIGPKRKDFIKGTHLALRFFEDYNDGNMFGPFRGGHFTPKQQFMIALDEANRIGSYADDLWIDLLPIAQSPIYRYLLADYLSRDYDRKGLVLHHQGKYDEAIQSYDKTIQLDPKNASAWSNKGIVLYDMGKYDEAIQAYEMAVELDLNYAEAWYNKGIALAKQRKYTEAIQAYERAIELDLNYAKAWNNKGIVLYDMGKYDEAIQAYEKAIGINPQDAKAWNNKGIALDDQSKYDEAILAYDKAIEINPQFVEAWTNKSIPLENQGKYDEAIRACDKAIEINPQFAGAWNNKGWTLYKMGNYDESLQAADKSLELDAENAWAWNTRGAALSGLNRHEEALECFNKATEHDPQYAEAWYRRSVTLKSIGRNVEAETALAKSKELGYKS
jgi:tetratricopeptide (TPR) repeat protein